MMLVESGRERPLLLGASANDHRLGTTQLQWAPFIETGSFSRIENPEKRMKMRPQRFQPEEAGTALI